MRSLRYQMEMILESVWVKVETTLDVTTVVMIGSGVGAYNSLFTWETVCHLGCCWNNKCGCSAMSIWMSKALSAESGWHGKIFTSMMKIFQCYNMSQTPDWRIGTNVDIYIPVGVIAVGSVATPLASTVDTKRKHGIPATINNLMSGRRNRWSIVDTLRPELYKLSRVTWTTDGGKRWNSTTTLLVSISDYAGQGEIIIDNGA